jgi:hypothetical protein
MNRSCPKSSRAFWRLCPVLILCTISCSEREDSNPYSPKSPGTGIDPNRPVLIVTNPESPVLAMVLDGENGRWVLSGTRSGSGSLASLETVDHFLRGAASPDLSFSFNERGILESGELAGGYLFLLRHDTDGALEGMALECNTTRSLFLLAFDDSSNTWSTGLSASFPPFESKRIQVPVVSEENPSIRIVCSSGEEINDPRVIARFVSQQSADPLVVPAVFHRDHEESSRFWYTAAYTTWADTQAGFICEDHIGPLSDVNCQGEVVESADASLLANDFGLGGAGFLEIFTEVQSAIQGLDDLIKQLPDCRMTQPVRLEALANESRQIRIETPWGAFDWQLSEEMMNSQQCTEVQIDAEEPIVGLASQPMASVIGDSEAQFTIELQPWCQVQGATYEMIAYPSGQTPDSPLAHRVESTSNGSGNVLLRLANLLPSVNYGVDIRANTNAGQGLEIGHVWLAANARPTSRFVYDVINQYAYSGNLRLKGRLDYRFASQEAHASGGFSVHKTESVDQSWSSVVIPSGSFNRTATGQYFPHASMIQTQGYQKVHWTGTLGNPRSKDFYGQVRFDLRNRVAGFGFYELEVSFFPYDCRDDQGNPCPGFAYVASGSVCTLRLDTNEFRVQTY